MRNPTLFIYGYGSRATRQEVASFKVVLKVSGPPPLASVVVTRIDSGQSMEQSLDSWNPWLDLQGSPTKDVTYARGHVQRIGRSATLDGQAELERGDYRIQVVSAAGDSNIEHFRVHANGLVSWMEPALDAVRLDFLSPRPFDTRIGVDVEPDVLARVTNPDAGFFSRELFRAQLIVDGISHTWGPVDLICMSSLPGPGDQNTKWWSLDDWSLGASDLRPGRHRAVLAFGPLRSNEYVFEV